MEFLAGYAAAKAPFLTYEVEGSSHSHPSKPGRSNSTSGLTTKRRSRIPGHTRTNSASTSSSGGRIENQTPSPQTGDAGGWLLQPPGGADASGAGAEAEAAVRAHTDPVVAKQPQRQQHHSHHHQTTARRDPPRDRDWMPVPPNYYQDKRLPATPRLNTQDPSAGHPGTGGSSTEPASARAPASVSASTTATLGNPGAVVAAVTLRDRRMLQPAAMLPHQDGAGHAKMPGSSGPRAESASSVSGATMTSNRTIHSSEQPSDSAHPLRPFVVRNGRTYLGDPTLPYPLPVDLEELHRQSLKTMLLMQLYGRPICTPAFASKPPLRILEVGCAAGFWSMMCYRYYEARGLHRGISFTGLDIAHLPPGSGGGGGASSADSPADTRPEEGMNWRFVQHDLRKWPLPFPDAYFDFVMIKDMALAVTTTMEQGLIEEYIRILAPGGTIEIWETDHMLRMLRPHVPDLATTSGPVTGGADEEPATPTIGETDGDYLNNYTNAATSATDDITNDPTASSSASSGGEIHGAYIMTSNTPLSTPLNNFLVEYNGWVSRALEARAICAMPCTLIGPLLIQEAETLTGVGSVRLAVPLSEIRWEREGVGGVVTKNDGRSYIETTKARSKGPSATAGAAASGSGIDGGGGGGGGGTGPGRGLNPAAAALRRTALTTIVRKIQALEPMLREVSGKSQDEWDAWVGKMMNDLVKENGTSWGECLEVGVWWARKR